VGVLCLVLVLGVCWWCGGREERRWVWCCARKKEELECGGEWGGGDARFEKRERGERVVGSKERSMLDREKARMVGGSVLREERVMRY
jgi:hypothetical protein